MRPAPGPQRLRLTLLHPYPPAAECRLRPPRAADITMEKWEKEREKEEEEADALARARCQKRVAVVEVAVEVVAVG
jgi:hypothetical protein